MNTRLKMHENDARISKPMSVFDLQHKMSQESRQNDVKVNYLMPFQESKIYKLIISVGIRIAAASLSIQSSRLFTELNGSEKTLHITWEWDINSELWFFGGVSVGGLFSPAKNC